MTTKCARESCRQVADAVVCIELVSGRWGREYDIPLCQEHGIEFRHGREQISPPREWHGGLLQRDCWKCRGHGTVEPDAEICPECSGTGTHSRLIDRAPTVELPALLEVTLRLRRDFDNPDQERYWVTSLAAALGAEEVNSQRPDEPVEIPF